MKPGAFLLVALLALLPSLAGACSCREPVDTKQAAREQAQRLFGYADNVVLLRAVEVIAVGPDHQRARFEVVQVWKGSHKPGDIVMSDTPMIGHGTCNQAIAVGTEMLVGLATDGEPFLVSGCPGMFELTKRERRYLDKLAPKKSRSAAD